jgi:nicotinamide-nucleotide amidase
MMDKVNELVMKLAREGKTISAMESCTGGSFANAITNIAGSSDVIKFSAVTYSNDFKIKLGVPQDVIEKFSVYSEQVASCMAKAISLYAESDFGVGITGKLNRVDKNNISGEDNEVFVSIFNRNSNVSSCFKITVLNTDRQTNKNFIVLKVAEYLLEHF